MRFRSPLHCRHLAAAVLSTLFLIGCSPGPPTGVLLITIDTLRADHLGAYGYPLETSPNLDALAKESVLFRHALAPSPWTLPSVATLFTSLYPTVHGASRVSHAPDTNRAAFTPTSKLADELVTLPELVREEGFATAAFIRGAYPTSVYGFDQGFDLFEETKTLGLRRSTKQLLAWLDREAPERFFIYLHTIEVHAPYDLKPAARRQLEQLTTEERKSFGATMRQEAARYRSFDPNPDYRGAVTGSNDDLASLVERGNEVDRRDKQRLVELYDRGIRYTDYWLGSLMDALRERGLFEQTIIIVTSDHGEEFWDHGGLDHGHTYYDELLRVPLVMRIPGEGRGVVVEQQVGLIDVLPTILDVLGVEPTTTLQGRSVRPLWTGEELPERSYFAEANNKTSGLAVRTDRWKLIGGDAAPVRLFDTWNDPNELHDVCAKEREVCQQLVDELREWKDEAIGKRRAMKLQSAPVAQPDEETLEELRALGYLE